MPTVFYSDLFSLAALRSWGAQDRAWSGLAWIQLFVWILLCLCMCLCSLQIYHSNHWTHDSSQGAQCRQIWTHNGFPTREGYTLLLITNKYIFKYIYTMTKYFSYQAAEAVLFFNLFFLSHLTYVQVLQRKTAWYLEVVKLSTKIMSSSEPHSLHWNIYWNVFCFFVFFLYHKLLSKKFSILQIWPYSTSNTQWRRPDQRPLIRGKLLIFHCHEMNKRYQWISLQTEKQIKGKQILVAKTCLSLMP